MNELETNRQQLESNGFSIIDNVFTEEQIKILSDKIDAADSSKATFRRTANLFAIRQFLKEVPATIPLIFTDKLKNIIHHLFGKNYFVVKSIYFDKPPGSNWFVAYHQDLTISVTAKANIEGYGPWTVKQDQYSVQPPLEILHNAFTIRIHLDTTDENNGALKVIDASHNAGICHVKDMELIKDKEVLCKVGRGGIMIIKPLLLHASGRSTNDNKRRVIHIEFNCCSLPGPLHWAELIDI